MWREKEQKIQITYFRIKESFDCTNNLKGSQEPPGVLIAHFDNHFIRIKPQKYKILSLCLVLLKAS